MIRNIDAVVLDGANHSSLAIVRNLGLREVRAAVAADTRYACAAASRHCCDFVVHPSPEDDPQGAVTVVLQYLRDAPGAVVFATSDRWHELIYANEQAFRAAGAVLGVPPAPMFRAVLDKAATLARARRLGVPVPRTCLPASIDELEALADRLSYPAVIKPRASVRVENGRVRPTGGVVYARNPGELRACFPTVAGCAPGPIVQEYIEGYGAGVFLLCEDGAPLLRFAHRRLRDAIPTGSASALRESIPYPAELGAYAEALAADLRWTGPMMVEFRVEPQSGRAYLMEINGRFWGSLQLAIDAGQEFPYAYYELCRGRRVAPSSSYRPGIRSRWLVGDLLHVSRVLRGRPDGFPGHYPSRAAAVWSVLRPSRVPTSIEGFWWSDLKPFVYEWMSYAERALARL